MDSGRYVTIGVERGYFSELREAKLQYQAELGRTISWSEFFKFLVGQRQVPDFVEMRQGDSVAEMIDTAGPSSEEERVRMGWQRDDVLTARVASLLPGAHVDLTEASCDLIAAKLYELMKKG